VYETKQLTILAVIIWALLFITFEMPNTVEMVITAEMFITVEITVLLRYLTVWKWRSLLIIECGQSVVMAISNLSSKAIKAILVNT